MKPSTALCALLLALAPALHAAPDAGVPTVAATAVAATGHAEFDAVLQPLRQATVAAQVGGTVLALHVQAGEAVRRGQPLLRLDDRELRAAVARSDAAVAQAAAEERNAELALTRSRDLQRSGFVSSAAVDNAETQSGAARAGLQQAQAARLQSTLARAHAELAAPFDAVVLATHVEAGDLALPGRALLTLYEPGRLRAVVQLPASRAAQIDAAPDLQVRLSDGRSLVPIRRELLPAADPVAQTVEWRLTLPADTGDARPGQTVRVVAKGAPAAGASARPTLPAQAVLRRGELTAVYVATGGQFTLRALRVGPAALGQVEVLAGLAAGERVALDPVRAGLRGARPAAP